MKEDFAITNHRSLLLKARGEAVTQHDLEAQHDTFIVRTAKRSSFYAGYDECATDIADGKLDDFLLELGWVKK